MASPVDSLAPGHGSASSGLPPAAHAGAGGGANQRFIEIIGGGLAGLSLGLALRQRDVPVIVREAHDYPRHRVCGEFIAGLGPDVMKDLGLAPLLRDALRLRRVAWFRDGRPVSRHELPAPALGISRYRFDARLADAFVAAGGRLYANDRVDVHAAPAGRVFANGRRPCRSPWLGLKLHIRGLPLDGDLEVHLGDNAYVGLSPVEDGRVNVCGLFRRRADSRGGRPPAGPGLMLPYLDEAGLGGLRERLQSAEIDAASFSAVAGFSFRALPPSSGRICLGDCLAMPPPFTGNGMAMALQGAALAVEPLQNWTTGRTSWPATIGEANRRLRRRFRIRLASARWLHPLLLTPGSQRWLARAGRSGLLPFDRLYGLTH